MADNFVMAARNSADLVWPGGKLTTVVGTGAPHAEFLLAHHPLWGVASMQSPGGFGRTTTISTQFKVDVPSWVATEVDATGGVLPSQDERMALAIHLADRNFREGGGGPFAALVVERLTGRVISAGVNRVLASNLSVSHAEVVALSLAQCRLGTWDLGARPDAPAELVVNWRPCLQCCGALLWSGISHLVIPDDSGELERLTGFDEGPLTVDWIEQFERRGINVTKGVRLPEALRVFNDYAEWVSQGRAVVYNARGTGVNV